jgi:hypothetical protein
MLELMNNMDDYRNQQTSSDMPDQTDEELALVKRTLDGFYKFKNYRKRYDAKWLDYYRLMRGQQWDYRRPKWKNSEVINFIWQAIQSQIPLQTDVRPRFSYLPQEPGDMEFAEILDSIAESDFEKNNWLRTVFEVIFDGYLYGIGYSSMNYDQEADYGMGSAVYVSEDPFFCYPHPDANEINDGESDIFYYVRPVETAKLKRAFPDRAEYLKPDIIDRVKKDRADLKTFSMQYFNSNRDLAEGAWRGSSETCSDDVPRTLVVECYMKPVDVEEKEEEEAKEGEGEGEEKDEGSKYVVTKKYPNGRHIVVACGMILHDGPLPYEDNMIPFSKYNNYILPREFFGVSEVEQLESPQIVFNKMLSFFLDAMALTGNPIWIVDSNSEVDTDNLANIPGSVVEKNPGSEVRREQGLGINPSAFSLLDRLVGWFNTVAGQSGELSQGEAPGGVTAASAIEQLVRISRTRVRQKQRNLDGYMKDAGMQYMNRVLEFYTVPKIFRITNKDGSQMFRKFRVERENGGQRRAVVSDFEQTTNGQMIEGPERNIILKGRLDVRVTTGSELPFDVADNERKALALFDRGIIDVEEVLTRIEYPNKEKVLNRIAQQQQMAAQQQAAAPQGGQ